MRWETNNKAFNILRIFLGLVFLSAGIFRIFNSEIAQLELTNLNLPQYFLWPIIVLEIIGGLLLLFNQYSKKILWLFTIFIIIALVLALSINGQEILLSSRELFVFNLNPTDFFLHFSFLIILITLLFSVKRK